MIRLALALLFALAAAGPAAAHVSENTKVRTIVVAPGEDGLVAFLRVPAPLLFSDAVAASIERGEPFADPFVRTETLGPAVRHRLSLDAVAADPEGFARRLAAAHDWRQTGRPVAAEVTGWRVLGRDPGAGFGTAAEARAAMAQEGARLDPVFGDAVVEIALRLDAPAPGADLGVRSALPPLALPPDMAIDNHLRDERGAGASLVVHGQLGDWATLDGSPLAAARAFAWQGVLHILKGSDHVLLVVCLALGAGASRRLLWLVTAFTLGHAITLAASFLGYVPRAAWFVPAVEASIAATVVYAAVTVWLGRLEAIWVMGAVGLLHGLGFSFVLSEILGRDAPGVVPALAAFTVGIELGQIAILAATLAVARAFATLSLRAEGAARVGVLVGIAVIASYWTLERALTLA